MLLNACGGRRFCPQNIATLGGCTSHKWLLHPPVYPSFAGAAGIGFLPRRGETFPKIDKSFADLSAGQGKGSLRGKIWCLKAEAAVVPILPVLQGETQSWRSRLFLTSTAALGFSFGWLGA